MTGSPTNCCSTHSEGFSLAAACNEAEALGLNGHSGALDMLLHVPDWKVKKKQWGHICFQESLSNVQLNLIKDVHSIHWPAIWTELPLLHLDEGISLQTGFLIRCFFTSWWKSSSQLSGYPSASPWSFSWAEATWHQPIPRLRSVLREKNKLELHWRISKNQRTQFSSISTSEQTHLRNQETRKLQCSYVTLNDSQMTGGKIE